MARTYARLMSSAWTDPEWTGLTSGAQWLAIVLATAPVDRTATPLDLAALAADVTASDVEAWLDELERSGVIDDRNPTTAHLRNRCTAPERRPYIPPKLRKAVYERDGYRCQHCGATEALSLDHVHPYVLGGEDTYDNFQTLCRPCNARKGANV